MRLIDADKIENATASDIEVYSFNLVPYIKVEDLLNFIDNQPTAYDIDKVVEELDKYLTKIVGRKAKLYTTIIDIVKAGGKNEV